MTARTALPAHWLRPSTAQVWIPGAPGLGRDRESRCDFWSLVRAWCTEEAFPRGVSVELTICTIGTPPALPRLVRIIEAAAQVQVARANVVTDGRQGIRLTVIGPGTQPIQLLLALDGGGQEPP